MSAASLDILPCALFTANAARFAVIAQGKTATECAPPSAWAGPIATRRTRNTTLP